MKRQFRLLKNQDFQKVIQAKQSKVNRSFVIYFKENELDHIRVGISVGNKYGCAVERNKAKRQVREMVHEIFDYTLTKDVVIIIRNEFSRRTFLKNKEELNYIYKKITEKVE